MEKHEADITIIGAGAAGLMAGFLCAQKGKKVLILEHNDKVGRKIAISGGGRCNFTNMYSNPDDFDSKNEHFCKSALSRFSPHDFIALIEEDHISYFEKKLGQLFCTKSAKDIINLLVKRNQQYGSTILTNQKNLKVTETDAGLFKIYNDKLEVKSKKLIIATGGLSIPTIGASDFGYLIAKRYGHKIIPTEPALVGLKIDGFAELAGTSLVASVSCGQKTITEDVLFTHKGLSGPAILKISLYYQPKDTLTINWLPEHSFDSLFANLPGNSQYRVILRKYLPNKFVDFLLKSLFIEQHANLSDLSKQKRTELKDALFNMTIKPTGTEGFRKAEVTRGGIHTNKVSSKSMESKLKKNLYFIGEVLDVTGQLGGHNFQWAWASAFAVSEELE